jgi:hypothetical protein
MCVDDLAQVPLSFPTYAGVLGRVAAMVTRQLNVTGSLSTDYTDSINQSV